MQILSPNFSNGESIPETYTCDGDNVHPGLEFHDVPADARSLAVVVSDPDATNGTFIHWLIWNIDPKYHSLGEGEVPEGSVEGMTSAQKTTYVGPCPPAGQNHRYVFSLHALSEVLDLPVTATIDDFNAAIDGYQVELAELAGKYQRKTT